jgi:glutathione synthase
MLKLLFIADPLETFIAYKDSTLAMMNAAHSAGHRVFHANAHTLSANNHEIHAFCQEISVDKKKNPWFAVVEQKLHNLQNFDGVIMRQDPPFSVEYLANTWLLSQAERRGVRVFNSPSALRDHSEKISILEFPDYIAPTIVSRSVEQIKDFHALNQDIVIKPLDGMGGMGVFRVGPDGLNIGSIVETLGEYGKRSLMAQKYLPEIKDGDKRLLLINGQAVPYVLARIPQAGDIRGNLAAGGKGVAQPLSPKETEIAQKLGPILMQRGLFIVGLDIIGKSLTEINVTSPTGFVEITEQTGFDVAKFWLEQIEQSIQDQ